MARYRKCCGNVFQRWWRRLFRKKFNEADMYKYAAKKLAEAIDRDILQHLYEGDYEQESDGHNSSTG